MNKIGLTSNKLKIIAIITMIIDHIGYYFYYIMSDSLYLSCRIIGRISMPIFAFLLVQGYLHTSNVKRYILRLFQYAIITQLAIYIVYIINSNYVPSYYVGVHEQLNILFSFVLSLVIIYILDNKNKLLISFSLNIIIKLIVLTIIISIYYVCSIDYQFIVPLMVVLIYFIEVLYNRKYMYNLFLLLTIFVCSALQGEIGKFSIISSLFILLYNGELGKRNVSLKRFFYFVFPLQHFVLYLISMLTYNLK